MTLPAPPVLKTTIIQLNRELDQEDRNYEILTNNYGGLDARAAEPFVEECASSSAKKKRRRSSANIDSEELAKRKNETKQLHSIIEKRRRIKINREFEALKYLIPACRSTHTPAPKKAAAGSASNANNNGNKIDGMYKLTILKSSVEYILYLHHIIQQQHQTIVSNNLGDDFEIDFARVPLDVNQYRNIDREFDFRALAEDCVESQPQSQPQTQSQTHDESPVDASGLTFDIAEEEEEGSAQLPSPDITPDMAPLLSALNKFNNNTAKAKGVLSYPSTANVSPLTNPVRSGAEGTRFALPDPAMKLTEPKKMLFKAKIPANNIIVSPSIASQDGAKLDHDASTALLALRKSSIDSLLN
ncbi:BHLH domain-containing protein [[Candida] zeylanoides]